MCYSVESSAKTSLYSLIAIILLLSSNVPHFKWIAMVLVGWCGMQFTELLLWLTNPRKSCTTANKIITLTLIPLVLFLQPLGVLLGSFFVKPWSACSYNRKLIITIVSIFSALGILIFFYGNIKKICTIVTPNGHLDWSTYTFTPNYSMKYLIGYCIWAIFCIVPLFLLWDISYKAIVAISILPLFAFYYGLKTDSSASIWCHYTSFTSLISILVYALYKFKIYNILK